MIMSSSQTRYQSSKCDLFIKLAAGQAWWSANRNSHDILLDGWMKKCCTGKHCYAHRQVHIARWINSETKDWCMLRDLWFLQRSWPIKRLRRTHRRLAVFRLPHVVQNHVLDENRHSFQDESQKQMYVDVVSCAMQLSVKANKRTVGWFKWRYPRIITEWDLHEHSRKLVDNHW